MADKPGADPGPITPEMHGLMNGLAETLDEVFNGEGVAKGERKVGFFLTTFNFGEAGRFNYISNAPKLDVRNMLRDIGARLDVRIGPERTGPLPGLGGEPHRRSAMHVPPVARKAAGMFTDAMADAGALLEAGFMAYLIAKHPNGADAATTAEMRWAYFAGCEHVFSSLMSIMDEDAEPTERDLARVSKIFLEVDAWRAQAELEFAKPGGTA